MIDNNNEIIIRYDLYEYTENIINGLSDDECQEIIDSIDNGYFTGIIKPKHIKKFLCNIVHEMMLKDAE